MTPLPSSDDHNQTERPDESAVTTERSEINGVRPPSWFDVLGIGAGLVIGGVLPLTAKAHLGSVLAVWGFALIVAIALIFVKTRFKVLLYILLLIIGNVPAILLLDHNKLAELTWVVAFFTAIIATGSVYYLVMARRSGKA